MSPVAISFVAVFGCAICNGAAAIVQKVGVDRQKNVHRFTPRILLHLLDNRLYLVGIGLDLVGWLLTLYAVHFLPLFLVEAVAASNIAITAIFEQIFLHRSLGRRGTTAIILVLLGLIAVSISATPHAASGVSSIFKVIIIITPILIGLAAIMPARAHSRRTTIFLAALSGLAFGTTSIIGRILPVSHPFWHTIINPLVPALIVSGVLGTVLFSIALQRGAATLINAGMTIVQVAIPGTVGILFLGDHTRSSSWPVAIISVVLALGGILMLSAGVSSTSA